MKIVTLIATLLLPILVQGAAGADVPLGTVFSQLANLVILIGILVFFTRTPVAQAFKEKRESFLRAVGDASASRKLAEDRLAEVTARVQELRETYAQQVASAKKNAEESYRAQLADAKNEALRIQNSSQTNLDFEVQRQIENLRLETFQKSKGLAEKNLEKKLTPEQLKAWNSHFGLAEGAH